MHVMQFKMPDKIPTPKPEPNNRKAESVKDGSRYLTMLGIALATVISFVKYNSIPWAIFHGILGWIYVIYYAIFIG